MLFVFFTAVTNRYIYSQTNIGLMADESDYIKSAVSEVIEHNGSDSYPSYPSFNWDHLSRYMHMRKSTIFSLEINYIQPI